MSLLIKNADWIISPKKVRKHTSLYIENGKIVEFENQEADKVIDAKGHMVIPGFVNLHTHMPMNYLRGLAEDLQLQKWLNVGIWPKEKKLNGELVYLAAKLGIMEALQFGTTSFLSMYFFGKEVARAAEELGIRAWIGEASFDTQGDTSRAIRRTEGFVKTLKGKLVKPIVAPHSPYTCSKELLKESHRIASENDIVFTTHVSETKKEVKDMLKENGKSPLKYLDALGIVDWRFIGAHCVWLSPGEAMIMKRRGATIAHCPTSNMKLGSGMAPVYKYKGVNIGLGTDGQASNNNLDMINEMKMAALIQKVKGVFNKANVFEMVTTNGAKALGFNNNIKEGAVADLSIVDITKPHMQPLINGKQAQNNLIYAANGLDVKYTIVNGRIVYSGEFEYGGVLKKLKKILITLGIVED